MEDKQIIALLCRRAEQALAALEQKYGRLLHRLAANILGDPEDAAECVNDTYLALWNTIPPENPDPLSAYACRVGKNIALTRLRHERAQKRFCQYDVSLDELAQTLPGGTLEDTIDSRELGRAIDRFLDTLPAQSRRIFLRRYWFGDSVKDLAKAEGLTPNALSVRLARLRGQLKQYLYKEGFLYET